MTKILIVGKAPDVREFMAEELAGEGHLVVTIGSPAMIGELLNTLEPSLILLDFDLSRMDRWNTLETFKRRALYPPVLTFTSYNGDKGKIRLEVADGYAIQRFSFETFKQKIPELLRLKPIHGCEWAKEDLLLSSLLCSLGGENDLKFGRPGSSGLQVFDQKLWGGETEGS